MCRGLAGVGALVAFALSLAEHAGARHVGYYSVHLSAAPTSCLDVSGGASENGTPLEIWECNGLENQVFWWDQAAFRLRWGGDSSKCVDAGSGGQLWLWDCNDGWAQQSWGYDGTFFLTDTNTCMDLQGGDATHGNSVNIAPCRGLVSQQWTMRPGISIRISQVLNACLDLKDGNTDNGTPVQMKTCDGSPSQYWTFEPNSYTITYAMDTGKCLDAGDMKDATEVMIWDCNGNPQQTWGYGGQSPAIFLKDTSTCLHAGSVKDGSPVDVWSCNGCWNEEFQVIGPNMGLRHDVLPTPPKLRAEASCPPLALGAAAHGNEDLGDVSVA